MNLGHLRQDGELKFRLGEEQKDNSRFKTGFVYV